MYDLDDDDDDCSGSDFEEDPDAMDVPGFAFNITTEPSVNIDFTSNNSPYIQQPVLDIDGMFATENTHNNNSMNIPSDGSLVYSPELYMYNNNECNTILQNSRINFNTNQNQPKDGIFAPLPTVQTGHGVSEPQSILNITKPNFNQIAPSNGIFAPLPTVQTGHGVSEPQSILNITKPNFNQIAPANGIFAPLPTVQTGHGVSEPQSILNITKPNFNQIAPANGIFAPLSTMQTGQAVSEPQSILNITKPNFNQIAPANGIFAPLSTMQTGQAVSEPQSILNITKPNFNQIAPANGIFAPLPTVQTGHGVSEPQSILNITRPNFNQIAPASSSAGISSLKNKKISVNFNGIMKELDLKNAVIIRPPKSLEPIVGLQRKNDKAVSVINNSLLFNKNAMVNTNMTPISKLKLPQPVDNKKIISSSIKQGIPTISIGVTPNFNIKGAVRVHPNIIGTTKSIGVPKLINNNKFEIASEKDPIVHSNTSLRRNTQGPNPGFLTTGSARKILIVNKNNQMNKCGILQMQGSVRYIHGNRAVRISNIANSSTPKFNIVGKTDNRFNPTKVNGTAPITMPNDISIPGSSKDTGSMRYIHGNRAVRMSNIANSSTPKFNIVGKTNNRFNPTKVNGTAPITMPNDISIPGSSKDTGNNYAISKSTTLCYKDVISQINRSINSKEALDISLAGFLQTNKNPNQGKRRLMMPMKNENSSIPKRKPVSMDDVENDMMELGVAETYSTYMPSKLKLGCKHPDPVVETASLSSVAPVDVWYRLSIPKKIIESGALSALQLESITYASQAHNQFLPNGFRAGFLIGDGAGVGKGRTIAGIILENFAKNRERAVWVSISNDLKYDAERDLHDIGASDIKVYQLNKMKYNAKLSSEINGCVKKGVLFCTYSSLIGESNSSEGKYINRKDQILQWCGRDFDGLLIFDECHKAKNLCPSGSMKSTKTGQMVVDLQEALSKARVLYASATGASEPKNMAYMTRLGLWGKGTTFVTFDDFASAVEKKGVGGMEIVAMDMKLRGMYIARQLSFQDVKFSITEVSLDEKFVEVYNSSVKLWTNALNKFTKAANLVSANNNMKKSMWGQYWSAHQRFFKYLCIAAKVDKAMELAHNAIKFNDHCVVIGLQSTGEAGTLDQLEKCDGELMDFVSTAKGVFQNLVEKHFPSCNKSNVNKIVSSLSKAKVDNIKPNIRVRNLELEQEKMRKKQRDLLKSLDSNQDDSDNDDDDDDYSSDSSNNSEKERLEKKQREFEENQKVNNMINFIFKNNMNKYETATKIEKEEKPNLPSSYDIEEANQMKEELLKGIEELGKSLPKNTLDELIDSFGGPEHVAEMTGRKGRVVQKETGVHYESRSEQDVPLETLNVKERERFMNGEKMVAIISEAASSGISLQSDRRAANRRKRYHITLELPWSADKAVQQFGRTHRSNQVSAPEYVFLITNLAGERRFASIVAKRLESLGALTHGDRRASDNKDLSQFNIDNKYGKSALELVMKAVVGKDHPLIPPPVDYKGNFFQDVSKALIGVGLITSKKENDLTLDKEYNNMSKFLNRILGMPVDLQNRLFQYFTDTMNALIDMAKRDGTFDLGILDLGVSSQDVIKRVRTITFLYKHATGIAPIELHKLIVERGMSWKAAEEKYKEVCTEEYEGFFQSHQVSNGKHYVILLTKVDSTKRNFKNEDIKLRLYRPNTGRKNKITTASEIQLQYKKVEPQDAMNLWIEQYNCTVCTHKYWTGHCSIGTTCESGLRSKTYHVLAGSVLPIWLKIEAAISEKKSESKMQVIRLKTQDNIKIVGTLIKNNLVKGLIRVLREEAENVKEHDFYD
ncbi:protein strawberry notch homolog 1-like isoform X4 [Harmonia axyridis]|uniref:protein strawberry notch homolog 1-like isoform X4 n=1 Tax=Harmonia axyridis TaxID=115357 RepID=UPI001E275B53|nr:protein strawberry notch homolog 1-like isoform X4 [Harmonia axyridis]